MGKEMQVSRYQEVRRRPITEQREALELFQTRQIFRGVGAPYDMISFVHMNSIRRPSGVLARKKPATRLERSIVGNSGEVSSW